MQFKIVIIGMLIILGSAAFGQVSGVMQRGEPCYNCHEKIHLRTDSTSYFVDNDDERKFYLVYYPMEKNYSIAKDTSSSENWTPTTETRATVTSSGSVATGDAMYNGTCTFVNACTYALSVPTPVNSEITDIRWTFGYSTSGWCWLEDGAVTFDYLGCTSPSTAGFFWYCASPSPGTCTGSNVSIFSDFSSCIPAPSCASYNMDFTMNFYESCWGSPGCSFDCIAADSPWTMVIEGETVDNTALAGGSLGTIVVPCSTDVLLDANAQYGVPGYSYLWSNGATSDTQILNHTSNGTYTYSVLVTDACGETSTSSVDVEVSGCSFTLPVELVHFNVEALDFGNELTWSTLSERDNDYFIIQYSTNGYDWVDIGKKMGAGNSSEQIDYSFIHETPFAGKNYYRLKQVDFDGSWEFSDIQLINLGNKFTLFPNPATEQFQVVMEEGAEYPFIMELRDAQGKLIHSQIISENYTNISCSAFNKGLYIVSIFKDEEIYSISKLILR